MYDSHIYDSNIYDSHIYDYDVLCAKIYETRTK